MNQATPDNVFVRERIEGEFRSVSLQELIDAGMGGVALRHVLHWLVGYEEGTVITREQIQKGLEAIEAVRVTIGEEINPTNV